MALGKEPSDSPGDSSRSSRETLGTRRTSGRTTPATTVYTISSDDDDDMAGLATGGDGDDGSEWEQAEEVLDSDDDVVMQEAIRLSTQTPSVISARASSSSTSAAAAPRQAIDPEAQRRAAAAEVRIAQVAASSSGVGSSVDVKKEAAALSSSSKGKDTKPSKAHLLAAAQSKLLSKPKPVVKKRKTADLSSSEDDDLPLKVKAKGKVVKGKGKAAVKGAPKKKAEGLKFASSDEGGGFIKEEDEDGSDLHDPFGSDFDGGLSDSTLSTVSSVSSVSSVSTVGTSLPKTKKLKKSRKVKEPTSDKMTPKEEAKLAVLYVQLRSETEKAKSFMDLYTKRRLKKIQADISALEQKEVRAMVSREKRRLGKSHFTQFHKNQIQLWQYHPELKTIWGDLEADIPVIAPVQMPAPPGLKLTLLPFQRESLYWMKEQEKGVWKGGMLADEMGMGKTIQTISLMLSDVKTKTGPNLVLAPVVALKQWKSEIETHSEGLKVYIWHGAARSNVSFKTLTSYDVVVTSYGTLQSSWTKESKGTKKGGQVISEKSLAHKVEWHRIILDEAHNIKDRTTNVAKACFNLKGQYKWCLSGTPLQNRVGELYSLVRFLGGDPYSYYFCKNCPCKSLHWKFSNKANCDECGHNPTAHVCLWNNEILNPIVKLGTNEGFGKQAWKKLKLLLDRMMLRRTKIERADDLGLPPRTLVVRRDYFSPEEKEIYTSLFSDIKRQFSSYVNSGTVLNNYSNIFSLITRMRQAACHPDLVLRSKTASYIEDLDEATLCRLCQEVGEDVIKSKCNHCFDRECISTYLTGYGDGAAPCPVCNATITIDLDAEAIEQDETKVAKAKQGILGRLDIANWRSSTKLEALVEELTKLRAEDVTTKSLVFSQFVSFLDIIAFRLNRAGFKVCRLEGGMSLEARQATIDKFISSPDVCVFLISLKAGGVALNLTEANRVYLMDSWWNPAVEYQAMDRIHRLGQHRPVTVVKMAIEDSIESKIIQLQEKKLAMTDATLNSDANAMGKLTAEDLGFLFRL